MARAGEGDDRGGVQPASRTNDWALKIDAPCLMSPTCVYKGYLRGILSSAPANAKDGRADPIPVGLVAGCQKLRVRQSREMFKELSTGSHLWQHTNSAGTDEHGSQTRPCKDKLSCFPAPKRNSGCWQSTEGGRKG